MAGQLGQWWEQQYVGRHVTQSIEKLLSHFPHSARPEEFHERLCRGVSMVGARGKSTGSSRNSNPQELIRSANGVYAAITTR